MRILLVTHYFPPEIGAPQARLSELARHWAEAGEEVTVLTGMPNHPTGVVPPAYRRRSRIRERVDGYKVLRTWLYATPNEGVARKTVGHLSFMTSSLALGWRASGSADVVVVSSPTFFSIFSAWLLARTKRAAFVIEVRDLWPAIFVELGVLTNRWLIKLLELAELAAYHAADSVVVVSEGFRQDLIRRGVPEAKVHTVRNGVDLGRFSPGEPRSSEMRARLGAIGDETIVLYIGAHGISHGLEGVIEAASLLQGHAVHVALVGEGAVKTRVQARAAQLGVTNVTFLPGVPRDEVPGILAAADICLVPLRDVPLFTTFIPSKLFEYLAAGKAVVGSLRGEAAAILTAAGAVVVEPDNSGDLAGAIASLAADPVRLAEMGRGGRAYVVENFDRRALAAGYLSILRNTVASRARTCERDWGEAEPGPGIGVAGMAPRRDLGLLIRTTAFLRPEQVVHRVRLRTQRAALERWPLIGGALRLRASHAVPGWPGAFCPLDLVIDHPDAKDVARGHLCFLNEERWLGDPADWDQVDAARLWRFHLHYFEWAWALAQSADRPWAIEGFAELWGSWTGAVAFGKGDAWAPYVVSLRAWVLCGIYPTLVRGRGLEAEFVDALWRHAGFLRAHLELDIGGNHLIKNVKALVGLGVFLGRADLVRLGSRHLTHQLPIQVLSDGGHYERSPSYHCQVLGDLIDVRDLLKAAGEMPVDGLDEAIGTMRRWLGAMLGPDGEVPLFNDAAPVGAARLAVLAPSPAPAGRVVVLGASGYVVARPDERSFAVLDVGDPCPDDLPGHAHADCLSFELWVDGHRVVVDTATSTYESGARRCYERSTSAHNTVEVDGTDQTEVWAVFRAARRARGCLEMVSDEGGVVEVVASHDGYHHLHGAPVPRRRWTFAPGSVDIEDIVVGTGRHRVTSRLYLAEAAAGRCTVEGRGGATSEEHARAAWGFGRLYPVTARILRLGIVSLPRTLHWRISWLD